MADKILNQSQAEAVYSAMCHLNNVGGRIAVTFGERVRVMEMANGAVHVRQHLGGAWEPAELYADQSAFATAYGLQQG